MQSKPNSKAFEFDEFEGFLCSPDLFGGAPVCAMDTVPCFQTQNRAMNGVHQMCHTEQFYQRGCLEGSIVAALTELVGAHPIGAADYSTRGLYGGAEAPPAMSCKPMFCTRVPIQETAIF